MAKQIEYLESKPRYEILDGLRGVAALMVVIFHLFETYNPEGAQQHVNHGYLAVDFFFVLSGFVIGYAYDDRWNKMSTWSFFKRRLTRLHPMVWAGTFVGLALYAFGATAFPAITQAPLWKVFVCFVMALFMIPASPGMDIRGWEETNSFNGPNWTLTLEYIGNILYALVLRRLPTIILCVLAALSAVMTLDLTLGWDLLSFGNPQYSVIGGWSLTPQQIYIGFGRLLYPFLCGLIISRILPGHRSQTNPSGSPLHVKGGFWLAAIILVVIFSVPCITGAPGIANGIYQAVSIILIFPLVVLLGAGSKTTHPFSTKACKFLGDISYPIYITHYPFIYAHMSFAEAHADAPLWLHVLSAFGVVVMSVLLAWALLKLYDEPVREWLKNHWLRGEQKLPLWLKITMVVLAVSAIVVAAWR